MVYAEALEKGSYLLDKTIRRFLGELPTEQREQFTNVLFEVLRANENRTVSDIREAGMGALVGMLRSYDGLDEKSKQAVRNTVGLFFSEGVRSLKEMGDAQWQELRTMLVKGTKR